MEFLVDAVLEQCAWNVCWRELLLPRYVDWHRKGIILCVCCRLYDGGFLIEKYSWSLNGISVESL